MDHNDNGIGWHTHYYEPDTETNRFIRIFLYVTGFVAGDSNLVAIPGSHLLDVDELSRVMVPLSHSFESITEEAAAALAAVPHPVTGEPMGVERLACPPGSAVVMETKAAHAVEPKPEGSNSVRKAPYRCHLGCILPKMAAISLLSGRRIRRGGLALHVQRVRRPAQPVGVVFTGV